ncbi:MAG: hypothetical protein OXG04_10800 [Acidobacteria bacterium]|nr:hypothetical protein [Acidobacteriota bacterium]
MASFSSSPYPGASITARPLPHLLRDRAGVGRRRDPHDRGQVDRDPQVLVPERRPVRRVQHVEQCVGGRLVHPVDRLEDDDRIPHAGPVQSPDDGPGGIALPPAEQALGVSPAQRHAHVGVAERPGGGHRQRGLAGVNGHSNSPTRGHRKFPHPWLKTSMK